MTRKLLFLFTAITAIASTSCGPGNANKSNSTKSQTIAVEVPQFNGDSAYNFTAVQVAFGPRVPRTPAHEKCANYLSDKLRGFGADVIVQQGEMRAFDGSMMPIKNIIGQYQPEKRNRILLFAHWDSRPFADHDPDPARRNQPIDGANDGASGVGVLLEVARHLNSNPTTLGVDIILFDAEDYGMPDHIDMPYQPDTWCLGSQYWGKNPHKQGYEARYGILLDMVGAKNATFYKEGYSMEFAPQLVKEIWRTAASLGYGNYFIPSRGGTITDDHLYVNKHRGITCVDIIQFDPATDTSFGSYWHTHNDTMENVDSQTLKAVGQTLMTVIYNEN